MVTPTLKKGDTIAIFNVSDRPAKITINELTTGVTFLKKMGFKTKIYQKSFNKSTNITEIKKQLHEIFEDRTINGIVFSSGGTQALRLLKHLDYKIIKTHPKFMMGFSDCTHLLQAITQKCNFVTFHGPVIRNIVKWTKKTQKSFINFTVKKEYLNYSLDKKAHIFRTGQVKGEVFVGNDICNLAVISTLGLNDFRDKILFIENHSDHDPDMVEYWFSWYAALGILEQIKGVIFGNYLLEHKKTTLQKLYNIYLSHLNIPVASVNFFGEGENYPIPNGAKTFTDLKNKKISFYH
ncbi:MAG: LD-carboxypeptidase [Candidatus Gracilibacteria bacterium]